MTMRTWRPPPAVLGATVVESGLGDATPDAIIGRLELRGYAGPADLPALAAVLGAQEAFDGDDEDEATVESLAALFEFPIGWNPSTDVTIAQLDGQVVGWARVEHQAFEDEDGFRSRGYILPDVRRHGVGTAMLAVNERRLSAIAASIPETRPRWFHGWITDNMPGAAALFEQAGYTPFHFYVEMKRTAGDLVPALAPLNHAIEVVAPEPDELLEVHHVLASAFAGQWGIRSFSDADLMEMIGRLLADPAQDPGLWRVAKVDRRIISAVAVTIDRATLIGTVDALGTLPEERSCGVGSALLAAAIRVLEGHGARHIVLSVDTENADALGMYERFGFRAHKRGIGYRKAMPSVDPATPR